MTDIIFGKMSIYCFVIVLSRITGRWWGQVAPSLFKIPNKIICGKSCKTLFLNPLFTVKVFKDCCKSAVWIFKVQMFAGNHIEMGLHNFKLQTLVCKDCILQVWWPRPVEWRWLKAIMRKWMDNMVDCWSESPNFFITIFGFTQNHIRNSFLIFLLNDNWNENKCC